MFKPVGNKRSKRRNQAKFAALVKRGLAQMKCGYYIPCLRNTIYNRKESV